VRNVASALLDNVQKESPLRSDYKIAKFLGVGRTTVSSYRTGRILMPEETVLRLTNLIGYNPAPLFAELAAERAERAKLPEVARVWRESVKVLGRKKP
jgi:hypothetical protein